MDDSALEHSVASDASSIMLDGELGAPKLQEATFRSSSTGEQENKELGDEPDLSLLPDELGTQEEPSFDQNDAGGNGSLNMTQDSGIFTDYNTQNSTSADVPGDSVQGAEPGTGAVASPSCHMTPMTPTIPTTGSGIIPQLQNIVSTVNLGCSLDLKMISLHARNAEYNPKRFGAVIMRIREPRTTALIFHSGKVVCLGAKSEEQSRLAARKYARLVQKLGFPARFLDFRIRNMVASCDVCFPIRLEGLILAHQQFASYEPELFPGLIYRMVRPRVVLLIFVSGKVVITGAKTRGEIYEALENIYPILKGLRKEFKSSTED